MAKKKLWHVGCPRCVESRQGARSAILSMLARTTGRRSRPIGELMFQTTHGECRLDEGQNPRVAALQRSLTDLAAFLRAQREKTIHIWREAVNADQMLTTAHSLPRTQLDDHIPGLLQAYELQLETGAPATQRVVDVQSEQATAHGLHRWQQGYDLEEVSRELGRLNEAVVIQLEAYGRERPQLESEVMATARRMWAQMIGMESSKSIVEYFRLRQVEAAGHVKDLEQALEKIRELEQERAGLWHPGRARLARQAECRGDRRCRAEQGWHDSARAGAISACPRPQRGLASPSAGRRHGPGAFAGGEGDAPGSAAGHSSFVA